MAQVKLLKIGSTGIPTEFDVVNDEITLKSFAVDGGGPVLSATGLDMNGQKVSDLADATAAGDAVSKGYLETALGDYILETEKGAANGVAPLNGSSKIDAQYLPSYVDDIEEYANLAGFPATGEQGKIYVALNTNKTYRWSGSAYVEVSPSDVNSVFGRTGIVTAQAGDYTTDLVTEGSNLYFTDARAQMAAWDMSFTAGEAIAARDAVYVSGAGEVGKADCGTLAKSGLWGFAKASASAAASVGVRSSGKLGGFSGLTPGARQFLSSSGAITESLPTGTGSVIVQAGVALSATELGIQIMQLGRRA